MNYIEIKMNWRDINALRVKLILMNYLHHHQVKRLHLTKYSVDKASEQKSNAMLATVTQRALS